MIADFEEGRLKAKKLHQEKKMEEKTHCIENTMIWKNYYVFQYEASYRPVKNDHRFLTA